MGRRQLTAWLFRRALQSVVTFAVALTILFFLMRAAPGDPLARASESRPISPAELALLRARYGLDQPIGSQFLMFVRGFVRGDLGVSIEYGRPVTARAGCCWCCGSRLEIAARLRTGDGVQHSSAQARRMPLTYDH
jgi:hypothetical protein